MFSFFDFFHSLLCSFFAAAVDHQPQNETSDIDLWPNCSYASSLTVLRH